MKGAELLVKILERYGVSYIFGLPGDTTYFFRALNKSSIKFITMRDERGAGFAADVYARLSGKPGVFYVSRSAGATNAVTGIASSFLDGSPTLLIVDQVSRSDCFRRTRMYIELEQLFQPVTKGIDLIWRAKDIPKVMSRAWSLIQTPQKGSWCLILPLDVLDEETEEVYQDPNPIRVEDNSQKAVERLSHCLESSHHPIAILGPGVIESARSGELRPFIDRLSIPFFTTRLAKGVIEETHPLSYGATHFGLDGYRRGKIFSEVDLIITIGYDYADKAKPSYWNEGGKKRNLNITHFSGAKPPWYSPTEEYVVELKNFFTLATKSLSQRREPIHFSFPPFMEQAERKKAIKRKYGYHLLFDALNKLRIILNPEDIIIADNGMNKHYVEQYESPRPTTIISVGLSSIGFSIPAAVGASLARPESKIVVVCGDGGFMISVSDLATIRHLQLPVKIIMVADGAYGLIKGLQLEEFGDATGVDFTNPDFEYLARAFNLQYLAVHSREALDELQAIISSPMSSLIVLNQGYRFSKRANVIRHAKDMPMEFPERHQYGFLY